MNSARALLDELKKTDFENLDITNIGGWPKLVKGLVIMLVFALVLAIGFHLYVNPYQNELTQKVAVERQLRAELEGKANTASSLTAYRAQVQEAKEAFADLVRQLPSDTEVPGLLEDITYIGLGAGLVIDAVNLQPEVTHEFFVELPMKMQVRGDYHDMGTFVSGVASLPRIVTLHDFSISDSRAQDELVMEIEARTYRYNHRGGADAQQ